MVQTTYSRDEQPKIRKAATAARQGMWGRHILWVLIISVALAAIALFGSWALHAGELAQAQRSEPEKAADARQFDPPNLAPKNQ